MLDRGSIGTRERSYVPRDATQATSSACSAVSSGGPRFRARSPHQIGPEHFSGKSQRVHLAGRQPDQEGGWTIRTLSICCWQHATASHRQGFLERSHRH